MVNKRAGGEWSAACSSGKNNRKSLNLILLDVPQGHGFIFGGEEEKVIPFR
jgi:hypothetical protein